VRKVKRKPIYLMPEGGEYEVKSYIYLCYMKMISAVLITRNEAHIIGKTLEALQWCDEILVVDSGSTDGTLEICREKGSRILDYPFVGFGLQKQYAVSQAKHDWVLSIDADEVLSTGLQAEIKKTMESPAHEGYFLKRRLVFLGKEFRYGRESREYHLRLFNRRYGNFDSAKVHEKLVLSGSTHKLKNILYHYSYPDLSLYFHKFNKYTDVAALDLIEKQKSRSTLGIVLSFPFNFFKHWIVQGNIRNGYAGWLWSLLSALYPVVKYTKARRYVKEKT